jgi:hypothetical protein
MLCIELDVRCRMFKWKLKNINFHVSLKFVYSSIHIKMRGGVKRRNSILING